MGRRHIPVVRPAEGPVGSDARRVRAVRRWVLVGALAFVGPVVGTSTQAHAAPLNECAVSDNGDPIITSLQATPNSIDVTRAGQRLRFRLQVEDRGGPGPASGISKVWVGFGGTPTPEGGNFVVPYTSVHLVREASGAWVGSVFVPRGIRPGRVPLGVLLEDRAQHWRLFDTADLAAAGLPARVTVASRRDRRPPQLMSLRINPTVVDTRAAPATVTVTATARDRRAGVGEISVEGLGRITLAKVPGVPGTFSGTQKVGVWARPGTRKVRSAWVTDRVGYGAYFDYEALGRAGFDRELTIVSRKDTHPPAITRLTLTPSAVDVRTTDQTVTIRVRARDRQSGVRRVSAVFWRSGEGLDLRLTSGTAHRGVWEASRRFSRCEGWGRWERAIIYMTDQAGHQRSYSTRQLADKGWDRRIVITSADHSPPSADLFYNQDTPLTPLTVRFNEDVNGITPDSAIVQPWIDEGVFGPRVPGTWVCRDAANSPADCENGAIRSARFRPARTLAHTEHAVTLNPEFSLDVTDLAGNPFPARQILFNG